MWNKFQVNGKATWTTPLIKGFVLVFLLVTLNIVHILLYCFCCQLWTYNCRLVNVINWTEPLVVIYTTKDLIPKGKICLWYKMTKLKKHEYFDWYKEDRTTMSTIEIIQASKFDDWFKRYAYILCSKEIKLANKLYSSYYEYTTMQENQLNTKNIAFCRWSQRQL